MRTSSNLPLLRVKVPYHPTSLQHTHTHAPLHAHTQANHPLILQVSTQSLPCLRDLLRVFKPGVEPLLHSTLIVLLHQTAHTAHTATEPRWITLNLYFSPCSTCSLTKTGTKTKPKLSTYFKPLLVSDQGKPCGQSQDQRKTRRCSLPTGKF